MKAGVVHDLAPGVRAVLAPNPSPFTYWGTWSYLLGEGDVALIDPGPDIDAHLTALLGALQPGERIATILLTHSHRDHSGLTAKLKAATGAPVLAFGPSEAGMSDLMISLGTRLGGGEGVDTGFTPDEVLGDGQVFEAGGQRLTALHVPGHMCNHLAFVGEGVAFTGDVVLGYASTYVSPPHGDLAQFRTSCARLAALDVPLFLTGHGAPLTAPKARIDWLSAHRAKREAGVLTALATGPMDLAGLTRAAYPDLPEAAHPAAQRNLVAHLVDLWSQDRVAVTPEPGLEAIWQLA